MDHQASPKTLALLGVDTDTLWLVRQWHRQHRWRVVAVATERPQMLDDALAGAEQVAPEMWYEGVDADAVLVSSHLSAAQLTVLKQLVSLGKTLLIIHPAMESLAAYELSMHVSDTPWRVLVWYPQRRLDWEQPLPEWSRHLGEIQRIRWTATVASADRETIVTDLARAAHWCLPWTGGCQAVQAIDPAGTSETIHWDRLTVTVTSPREVALQWEVRTDPNQQHAVTHVRLEGTKSELELQYDGELRRWSVIRGRVEDFPQADDPAEAARWVAERLARCSAGDDRGDDWLAACQTMEVPDVMEYSVRRRRMVDLVQEAPTEETSFKGVMAAGSCALLLLVLAIFAVGALWESIHRTRPRPGERVAKQSDESESENPGRVRWWRFWPAFPLLAYLLLQLLILVARKTNASASENGTPETTQQRQME